MKKVTIVSATYIDGHRLDLHFSDGISQLIDFGPFLQNHPHPQHNKYQDVDNFRMFHLERGNVVWGEDWDLIFPIGQLHEGYMAPAVY